MSKLLTRAAGNIPFAEAAGFAANKVLLPTSLTNKEINALDRAIKQRALWSAQVTNGEILDQVYGSINDLVAGKTDIATQRVMIAKMAEQVEEPMSNARIDLVLKTQLALANGYGQRMRSIDPDLLDEYPAWRLIRRGSRLKERNWRERWDEAAADTPEEGRNDDELMALKTHPIWESLGSTDIFDDALDVDYPPFAFNSGMGVEEVNRDEAIAVGLIDETTPMESPEEMEDFSQGFQSSYEFRSEMLRDMILDMAEGLEFVGGILQAVGGA